MNSRFYMKLALTNIKKNSKFYLPYLLTGTGTVAMFYIMCMIATNEGVLNMRGGDTLSFILMFGTIVIGVFSTIFLLYTNSFLMKRRKKELGLYNILGMEKQHIAKILFFETVFTGIGMILTGLGFGILFSKLIFMLLFRMLKFSVPMSFIISTVSIAVTALLFCGIFIVTLLANLLQIRLTKPIDLLKGGNIGEREPKSKWLITIIGLLTTGAGYFIALVTKSPLDAVSLFFIAVLLVIAGTYCLFTAGSITLLKTMRKNKGYYYKTKHFTSISGMIYRMKQNAVGLANICILSTMVLVMVSTTVSLYAGAEDALLTSYPTDIKIIVYNPEEGQRESALKLTMDTVEQQNRIMTNLLDYKRLTFAVKRAGNTFSTDLDNRAYNADVYSLSFLSSGEYERLTGNKVDLSKNEVLVYGLQEGFGSSFTLFDQEYRIVKRLEDFPIESEHGTMIVNIVSIVVEDEAMLEGLYQKQLAAYGENASNMDYFISFDMNGSKEEKIACYNALIKAIRSIAPESYIYCRQAIESEFYSMYGGLFFLGLFLGLLFLMATVLIIYYKQISEGYDDKERYEIMQKVGMSRSEVRSSISSQILKVFFLPLVMSIIHITAAFKMITKLLLVFKLTNIPLFLGCTALTILIFAIIYAIVYVLTARAYYRIVS